MPDDAEAERLFAALADGGQVQMPLTKTFFSSRFGMVADRFGVSWMIVVAPDGVDAIPKHQRHLMKEMTMRFMMLMIPKGYEKAAPGTMPDAKAVAAMMKYNESLQKAGVLLALDGLHPPSMGARVSFSGGKPKVTDGPFTEAKEVLGGYWMIQVKSKEEAIEWASRCPARTTR